MTRRAILWCGQAKPGTQYDFPASVHDLDLAARAAQALGVALEDIHAFVGHEDLLPPRFASPPNRATVTELRRVTGELARRKGGDDVLLFVATNHGLREGLLTSAPVDEFDAPDEFGESAVNLLTPEALEECLTPLGGSQTLVLATCFSGAFLRLGNEQSRIVLTACSDTETFRVEGETPCSPFLLELFASWCGVTLPGNVLPSMEAAIESAFDAAEQRLASEYTTTRPLRRGSAAWPR